MASHTFNLSEQGACLLEERHLETTQEILDLFPGDKQRIAVRFKGNRSINVDVFTELKYNSRVKEDEIDAITFNKTNYAGSYSHIEISARESVGGGMLNVSINSEDESLVDQAQAKFIALERSARVWYHFIFRYPSIIGALFVTYAFMLWFVNAAVVVHFKPSPPADWLVWGTLMVATAIATVTGPQLVRLFVVNVGASERANKKVAGIAGGLASPSLG